MTDQGMVTVIQGDTHVRARDAREPGHFWADNELIGYLPQIGPMGFTLYMLLAFHAKNNTGRAWPSVATLAKEMGVSEPSVLKYTEVLETAKLIVVTRPQSVSKNGKVVRHNCTYTLINLKHQAEKQAGGGKNILPGVVKEFYQGGKRDLPGVVNDVEYNNTKNNKTKRTKRNTSLPVAIAPATDEPQKQINAVLKKVEQDQNTQPIPSNPGVLKEEKVSMPPATSTEARYVSRRMDLDSFTHVEHLVSAKVKTPHPVCKRCKEKLSEGTISQTPAAGVVYTRCAETAKKPKVPAINKPLLDAIAIHIEGIQPDLAGGLTGTLAGLAGQVWKRKLGIQTLNAEQYNSIARSIPRFLEWYRVECQGCSPPKDKNKFESWYAKFCSAPHSAPGDDTDLKAKQESEQKQAMKEAYGFEV